MKKQSKLILFAVVLFAFSLDTGNAAQKPDRSAAVNRQTRTPELGSIDRFKEAFQNDEGKVRLVALISPT
jgi:hypothetical protein